jgi:hypothetical protein
MTTEAPHVIGVVVARLYTSYARASCGDGSFVCRSNESRKFHLGNDDDDDDDDDDNAIAPEAALSCAR